MTKTDLFWLPKHSDFQSALKAWRESSGSLPDKIRGLRALANHNLNFTQAANLHRSLDQALSQSDGKDAGLPTLRLALLSSATIEHLLPALHTAALRRGLLLRCYETSFNQYQQDLLDASSPLYAFQPDAIVLILHSGELGLRLPLGSSEADVSKAIDRKLEEWTRLWALAKERTKAQFIQSTIVIPPLQIFGQMDNLIPAAPANILAQVNRELRTRAAGNGILLLDLEGLASRIGKYEWCNDSLWFHAKQDLPLAHAPLIGDYMARLFTAIRGSSAKCLVLDLDDTLWGGTIGDDGLQNLVIGQGHAVGEAYQAFQNYLKQLKDRGVLLAVCSKNSEANARLPFDRHLEMILRRDDFAVFIANWENKAANLQEIASRLNIGLDSLVFFDDSPAEREQIRQFLPEVAVPEVPSDPADFPLVLSEAGYFEAAAFTPEDRGRTESYQTLSKQAGLQASPHDLDGFLNGLQMEMVASAFDEPGFSRVTQLINKSNQFNLTTRRYSESVVRKIAGRPDCLTMQIRLRDRLADHGMISVLIAEPEAEKVLRIDTWLMSCRVLGRQVEQEVLNLLVDQARRRGFEFIVGDYSPTEKNQIVRDHYLRLGFQPVTADVRESAGSRWRLELKTFFRKSTHIRSTFLERNVHEQGANL